MKRGCRKNSLIHIDRIDPCDSKGFKKNPVSLLHNVLLPFYFSAAEYKLRGRLT